MTLSDHITALARAARAALAFRPQAPGPLPSRPDLPEAPWRGVRTQNPIPALGTVTVAALRSALGEHEFGQFQSSALITDLMTRNPRIEAALNTRTIGVLGLPFAVLPGGGCKARKAAAAWEALWPFVAPEDVLAELLRWTIAQGVGLAEVVWETDGGAWVPRLKPWHPVWLFWRWDTWSYWVITADAGLVEVVPGDGRWLLLSYGSTRGWMRGVVRCLALEDQVRGYAVRDWARWCEKHGLPIMKLKVPAAQRATQEVADFFALMSALGSEGTLVLPQADDPRQEASFDAELLEPKDRGWEGFERLVERMDTDAAIAILGQNLTQNVQSGSYAAATVHDRVRADYLEADAALLATAIRQQVAAPWALWNYGDPAAAPWSLYDATPPDDLAALAGTLANAAKAWATFRGAGLELDPADFAARFRLRLMTPEGAAARALPVPAAPALARLVRLARARHPLPEDDGPDLRVVA